MIRVQVINGKVSHTPQEEVRHDASDMGEHATHVFRAGKLRTHGRFVQLACVPTCPYLFVDETEVYEGNARATPRTAARPSLSR
jgi:hypothetical protein